MSFGAPPLLVAAPRMRAPAVGDAALIRLTAPRAHVRRQRFAWADCSGVIGGLEPLAAPLVIAIVDWAGNKVPPRPKASQHEHESEVLMCIAGGMADAMHLDPKNPIAWKNWKRQASSADISIARTHRGQIERPQTWEHYEELTHAMLLQFWPMVEAVAAALMRHGFLDAGGVDSICGRVVRQQHLK